MTFHTDVELMIALARDYDDLRMITEVGHLSDADKEYVFGAFTTACRTAKEPDSLIVSTEEWLAFLDESSWVFV